MSKVQKTKIKLSKEAQAIIAEGQTARRAVKWTPEIDALLTEYYGTMPTKFLVKLLRQETTYNCKSDTPLKARIEFLGLTT